MKKIILSVSTIIFPLVILGEDSAEQIFERGMVDIENEYRKNFSRELLEANRVILYRVDFNELSKPRPGDPFGDADEGDDGIYIPSFNLVAPIIDQKVLDGTDRDKILQALAKQIAKPEHSGGPMAHFPNHGIRIYRNQRLFFQSTFSWATGNFPFAYPKGSSWLDSNSEIQRMFMAILPLPEEYLIRLERKYPSTRKRIEQAGAGQAATAPESKPDGDQNPNSESQVQPQ